jgi:hypothetical protein
MTDVPTPEPGSLSLDVLRAERARLQAEDDVVSYVRRVAQARLDIVDRTIESRRTAAAGADPIDAELRDVLSNRLTGGPARPPRPAEDLSDDRLANEFDELCAEHGFGRLDVLDDAKLAALRAAIAGFEQRVSADRKARFARLDKLSAELVRRYRDGEASVDALYHD